MYIIYIKIIFIRLPDPLMLPVGENKGELSAVADPHRIIRGARAPRAAPLDPQLIRSKANSDVADNETNAHD